MDNELIWLISRIYLYIFVPREIIHPVGEASNTLRERVSFIPPLQLPQKDNHLKKSQGVLRRKLKYI